MEGYLRLGWIGTFGEFVQSDTLIPKYARASFHMEKKLADANDFKKDYAPVRPGA